jgi:hypothetical protein
MLDGANPVDVSSQRVELQSKSLNRGARAHVENPFGFALLGAVSTISGYLQADRDREPDDSDADHRGTQTAHQSNPII